jgi:succinoglycan biosynthesis protein ExoV
MKLYYYQSPKGEKNFGDDLNPWLWQKIMPGILDNNEKVAFIGIGTLINSTLSRRTEGALKRIIFGTGAGYDKPVSQLDESYKVYCLRGVLSARSLGLPDSLAVTDAAVLIRKVFNNNAAKKYRFSYMPHHKLAVRGWENVCQKLGFGYIDPRGTVDEILPQLCQTEVLLAEAMHGAIIADALRIPWIPIATNSSILKFKWQDWCSSINVEYQPEYIYRLHNPREKKDILTPIRMGKTWLAEQKACAELKRVATNTSPFLSQDSCIETLTDRLEEKLNEFKKDWSDGLFALPNS